MKNAGAAAVIIGFILWFGGEFIGIQPYNIIGLPILIVGAVLYFVGRKKTKS